MTPDQLRAYIDEFVRGYWELLEEMCERSLTDPAGRGVVVIGSDMAYSMGLDEHVPYGHVYHFPSQHAYEEWQEAGWPG